MRAAAEKALAKIYSTEMFSKEGWKRVDKACGHIVPDENATHPDIENGNGVINYMQIWWDDNGIDESEFSPEKVDEINDILIQRFVDYLQHD